MSESDTVFNERDRRCVAVQRMLSTDPSYDNMTISSTLKMQIPQHQSIRRAPTGACGKGMLRIGIEAVIEAKSGYIE